MIRCATGAQHHGPVLLDGSDHLLGVNELARVDEQELLATLGGRTVSISSLCRSSSLLTLAFPNLPGLGYRGLCSFQPQVLHVGLKVAVGEQQRQVGFNAGGGDDPVNRLAHGDALAA